MGKDLKEIREKRVFLYDKIIVFYSPCLVYWCRYYDVSIFFIKNFLYIMMRVFECLPFIEIEVSIKKVCSIYTLKHQWHNINV